MSRKMSIDLTRLDTFMQLVNGKTERDRNRTLLVVIR
jgi:hypothetical protein